MPMVHYVVLGGGVSGVCCAEQLCRCCPDDLVTLVTKDRVIKTVDVRSRITRNLEEVKVHEANITTLRYLNLKVEISLATDICFDNKMVTLKNGVKVQYDKLCICTGARPRRLLQSQHVTVLRDTDSVATLASKLRTARSIIIVGNGGIAMELAYGLQGIDTVWIVREEYIGDAFFDRDAGNFLIQDIDRERQSKPSTSIDRACSEAQGVGGSSHKSQVSPSDGDVYSPAVGPAWTSSLPCGLGNGTLQIELNRQVVSIEESDACNRGRGRLAVTLDDSRILYGDLIVSAIGVEPAVEWTPERLIKAMDGGIVVNSNMQTSESDVYAAGDACTMKLDGSRSSQWFQMRLWSQARAQGIYAAHCMCGVKDDFGSDMAFELFTHVTRFLGKKVVLIGLYNGQGLCDDNGKDMVTYCRIGEGPDRTFVRLLLSRDRLQGAVLIGDTGMEETMENLILDGLDVSTFGPSLLDPEIELDHIFD